MLKFLTFIAFSVLFLFYFLLVTVTGERLSYPLSFFWIFVFLFLFFLYFFFKNIKAKERKVKLDISPFVAGLLGGLSLPLFYFRQSVYIPPQSDLLFLLLLVPFFTLLLTIGFSKILSLKFKNQFQLETKTDSFSYIPLLLAYLFGLFSAVSVLSNLERPSSFAPLVRFLNLEIFPLVSSILLSLSMSYFILRSRFFGVELKTDFNWPLGFVFGGFLFSFLWLANQGEGFVIELSSFHLPLILSITLAVFFRFLKAWRYNLKEFFLKLHFIYFSPFLMVLIFSPLERLKETFLFSPLVLKGIAGGAALFLVSLVVSTIKLSKFPQDRFGLILFGLTLAIFSLLILTTPYFFYEVSGRPGSAISFSKSWTSPGYEFVVPWCFFLTSFLLLFLARSEKIGLLKGSCCLICLSIFLPWLARTRLWNWFAFLPPEVSDAIGTEYINWQEKISLSFYYHLSSYIIILAAMIALVYFFVEFYSEKRSGKM